MSTVRRLLTCGAVSAVAGPVFWVLATPGTAVAASVTSPPKPSVTCSGNGCSGQKPELTGCDKDGQTIRTGQVFDPGGKAIGTIELRWSPTCQTNWARVTSRIGVQPLSATVTRDDAKGAAANFDGTQTWSPMVFVGQTAKAQATGWVGKGSGAVSDGAPRPGGNFN